MTSRTNCKFSIASRVRIFSWSWPGPRLEDGDEVLEVVAVDGPDVVEAELLKQHRPLLAWSSPLAVKQAPQTAPPPPPVTPTDRHSHPSAAAVAGAGAVAMGGQAPPSALP